jgi:hypothetical protein
LISAAGALDVQFKKDTAALVQASEIWRSGYAPLGNYLLIRTVDEMLVMTRLMTSLGMPTDQCEVLIDKQTREENWCVELTREVKNLGFKVFSIERLPKMISGARAPEIQRRRVALSVKESSTGVLRSQKAAHFLLLIVACSAVEYQISDKK